MLGSHGSYFLPMDDLPGSLACRAMLEKAHARISPSQPMDMSKKRTKKPAPPQLCQHPESVSYQPKKGTAPLVWEQLQESESDVKTCSAIATWVDPKTGVHMCDRHRDIFHNSSNEVYGEYTAEPGLPDEPVDPQFNGGSKL
jgi:hypothetical protein